jgi:hypothetical protein
LAMQNSVEPRDMGVATSATTFFRQVGGSLGTAIFLSILFSNAASKIPGEYVKAGKTPAFQAAAAAHPDQLKLLTGGGSLNDTSFLQHINGTLAHPFLVGFSDSMDVVFLVGGIVLIAAVVFSIRMKEVPLRTQSGLQAAQAARDAASKSAAGDGDAEMSEPVSRLGEGMPGAGMAIDEEYRDAHPGTGKR